MKELFNSFSPHFTECKNSIPSSRYSHLSAAGYDGPPSPNYNAAITDSYHEHGLFQYHSFEIVNQARKISIWTLVFSIVVGGGGCKF